MTFTLWIVYALNLTKLQTDGEWRPWTRATKTRQKTNAKFYNKTRANNNVMNECVRDLYVRVRARMWLWWVCIEYSRGALNYKNDVQFNFGLRKLVWFRADNWESEGTRECVCESEREKSRNIQIHSTSGSGSWMRAMINEAMTSKIILIEKCWTMNVFKYR